MLVLWYGNYSRISISLGANLCFIIELDSIERYMLSLGVALTKLSDSQSVRPSFFFSLNASDFAEHHAQLQHVNYNK